MALLTTDVDASVLGDDGVDHARDVGGQLATFGDGDRLAADRGDVLAVASAVAVDVVDDDIGALAGIGERDVAADAGGRPPVMCATCPSAARNSPLNCIFLRKNNAKAAGQASQEAPRPSKLPLPSAILST